MHLFRKALGNHELKRIAFSEILTKVKIDHDGFDSREVFLLGASLPHFISVPMSVLWEEGWDGQAPISGNVKNQDKT